MNFISTAIRFVTLHWQVIVGGAVFVATATRFAFDFYGTRKLRLEIKMLRAQLEQNRPSAISIATLKEIAKYAKTHPGQRNLRNFIEMKVREDQARTHAEQPLTAEETGEIAATLDSIEKVTPGFRYDLFTLLVDVVYPCLAVITLVWASHPLHGLYAVAVNVLIVVYVPLCAFAFNRCR